MTARCSRVSMLGLIVFAFLGVNAFSQTTKTVVISQVYSSQFAEPRLNNDFVELFNLSADSVNLTGLSLQIGKGSSEDWAVLPLTGTLAPGQYYLVRAGTSQVGLGKNETPAGDANSTFTLDPSAGRIAIATSIDVLPNPCPAPLYTLDFFSYGTGSGCDSGNPAGTQAEAIIRAAGGCVGDFSIATPYPRTSNAPRSLCDTPDASAQAAFTVPAGGGFSKKTLGAGSSIGVGSALVSASGSSPNGLAIFGFRQGGTLVSEATVPASPLVRNALVYAEVNSPGTTGIAISNPNNQDVNIRVTFWNAANGTATQSSLMTVQPKAQLARFLNEMPFGLASGSRGSIELQADAPIGVIALRGFTNERSEFLVTTLPVVDLSVTPSTNPTYLAHFAVEGGWRTTIYLLNSSGSSETGTIDFRDPSGLPIKVPFIGGAESSLPYAVAAKSSTTLSFTGTGADIKSGSVQITPSAGMSAPVPVAEFSYRRNNVTVSVAGLTGIIGTKFRTYVEASGSPETNGSIQSGLAIGNVNAQATTVDLQLVRMDGTSTGLSTTVNLPANGQVARFLNQLFPTVPTTFQGFLRASTSGSITMVGLRSRYNERGDFLITTVPPADENAAATSAVVFPHFADAGGYTTQFVLFGSAGQASSGTLRTLNPAGRNLAIQLQ